MPVQELKLQGSGGVGTGATGTVTAQISPDVGSYKPVPESDTEYSQRINSNMVKERDDTCADGADEEMLNAEEKKLTTKGEVADVKFVADHQNGDTKVDILEIKQGFTGLTKEELMKYCNDPFWVRLRWFMFILFWLIWFGMLAGAIYIILMANKCEPPPPKTWWQKGPLIDLDADDSFSSYDTKNYFKTLEENLPKLAAFPGVIISKNLEISDAYSPYSYNLSGFDSFITKAKDKDIRVIIDLNPISVDINHEWFQLSESRNNSYEDYFIWRTGKNSGVPNNWLSLSDGTAWKYSEKRNQYYLNRFNNGTADLNFHNPIVIEEFSKVLESWITAGASGIRLSNVKHLLVDEKFDDEVEDTDVRGYVFTDYLFFNHAKTTNQIGLSKLFKKWKDIVLKHTEGKGVLMMKEDVEDSTSVLKLNGTLLVDLPSASQPLLRDLEQQNSTNLNSTIHMAFRRFGNDSWPSWKFNNEVGSSLSSEFRILTALLPGVPVVTMKQVNLGSSNTSFVDEEYKNIMTLRSAPSLMYGGYNSSILADKAIFGYTRLKSGNPGYIVLFNTGTVTKSADITTLHKMPSEVTVNLLSKNYNVPDIDVKAKMSSNNIMVSAKSAIVLSYVQES